MKKFSIIIPFYFNEKNIPITLKKIYEVSDRIRDKYQIEFIFIDDGSLDETWELLNKGYNPSYNHKLIKLSKNFGSHNAIIAGLNAAVGDAIGLITSDLQDPPELFIKMLNKWENGKNIVLAVRNAREDNFLQRFFSRTYYRLLRRFSNTNMPLEGFDFFLIDKKVSKILILMNEKNSSVTCQIAWAGFNRKILHYKREKREIGKSKWTLSKKLKLFTDSFIAFSVFPIRLIQLFGVIFSIIGFAYIIVIIVLKALDKIPIQGIATVIAILCLAAGLILLSLSILGEYIWRILDESRKRPPYIIEKYLSINKRS